MKRELFLIGNSTVGLGGHLNHCDFEIQNFLGHMDKGDIIAYIPYATEDWQAYSRRAKETFSELGYTARSVIDVVHPSLVLNSPKTKAIFIEGEDDFLLCKMLRHFNLESLICRDVQNGTKKYIGSGAGVIIACPILPRIPMELKALNLVDLQISPQSIPKKLVHKNGESSKEDVLLHEYHRLHNNLVVGLPESSLIQIKKGEAVLIGRESASIHVKGKTEGQFWLPGEARSIIGTA